MNRPKMSILLSGIFFTRLGLDFVDGLSLLDESASKMNELLEFCELPYL